MPVSGLVLTLSGDADQRCAATESLRRHPAIELGEDRGHRLPVVVDTRSSDEDKQVWDWLRELPGVLFVDLVCADASQDGGLAGADHALTPSGAGDDAQRGRRRP